MKNAIICTVFFVILSAALSQAQQANVRIAFDGGRVTLAATDALVSDVLAEWTRVGGTLITGADRLPPSKVTVNLTAVDEKSAIEAVIGTATGYLLMPRTDAPAGSSLTHRLAILPLSASAAAPAPVREIDANIPETRFAYPAPLIGDPDSLTAREPAVGRQSSSDSAAASAPLPMPEVRFQFVEPMVTPSPPEDETKSQNTANKRP
jgi:hypothetical protein